MYFHFLQRNYKKENWVPVAIMPHAAYVTKNYLSKSVFFHFVSRGDGKKSNQKFKTKPEQISWPTQYQMMCILFTVISQL